MQVTQSLPDIAFLNCRPSVIAAAIVYAERRSRGIIPFWPSMLSKLSGYQVAHLASSGWPEIRALLALHAFAFSGKGLHNALSREYMQSVSYPACMVLTAATALQCGPLHHAPLQVYAAMTCCVLRLLLGA